MSIPARRAIAGAGAGVAVLALLLEATAPGPSAPPPRSATVVTTQLVCPDARVSSDGRTSTEVSAVTPSTLASGTVGRAVIGTPRAPGSVATITRGAHAAVHRPRVGTHAVIGTAVAGRAPGFAMDQLTTSTRTSDHGLAGTTCTEPDNDLWFVGSGAGVGHASTLYLTDPETTAATVDVTLFGVNGRIDAPAGLGVGVNGRSRRVLHLDRIAPGAGTIAVHVAVTSGRVGAALLDTEVRGLLARGADWVPAAEAPRAHIVVPGVGAGTGSHRLTLFAPGAGSASVQVRLVGLQGGFAPAGAASIDLDRGRVTTVDLGRALRNDQTAVVLDSDVPVVAGVRWATTGQTPDYAFTSATDPLTAPAVIAGMVAGKPWRSTLLVSAVGGSARVRVQVLVGGVPRGASVVQGIGADRTVVLGSPHKLRGYYQVVVTPLSGAGHVYAAVVRQRLVELAYGITVSDVHDARVRVDVPAARPEP